MKYIYMLIPLLSAILFFRAETIMAQVTIGFEAEPVKGAVLDIKTQAADADNITSATGGIVMPRMKLQSINTLEPMISIGDPDIAELKLLHTGLIVYNLTSDTSFKEGLYVWNGTQWEAVIFVGEPDREPVEAENGLTITPDGDFIELGGALDAHTTINQNNNRMNFTATGGTLSLNVTDFVIKGGNTGIGKEPFPGNKLDISGDTRIIGDMTVEGATELKDVEITGTVSAPSYLVYTPNDRKKANRYLVTAGLTDGLARWVSIGGLSAINMEPLPASTLRFDPAAASSQTTYQNTGIKIELPPGKWVINYSVRMVSLNLNTASATDIKPTSFRFTLLDNGIPIPDNGTGVVKPYDDCRAYPDTYYNALSGFFVAINDGLDDKEYYLGIKTQELGLNWPAGNVELINNSRNDAYMIPLFMGH